MTKRADFLALARAARSHTAGFVLQGRPRGSDDATMRVGYTCSKKVGNAVARNRAKRRLRALARDVLAREGCEGWDYVLIGRATATATRPFHEMQQDLSRALAQIHGKRP